MKKSWFLSTLLSVLFLGLINSSCSHKVVSIEKTKQETVRKDYYDTGPPVQGVSEKLEEIARSVFKLNVIAFYETYTFSEKANITPQMIKKHKMINHFENRIVSSNSVLGTAAVIYTEPERAVLITCAHVVNFRDTVMRFFPDKPGVLRSVSFKLKQNSYISGLENPQAELLVSDKKNDIALLEVQLSPMENISVLPVPVGKSSELNWGTFVYVMGFPQGEKMVETGIVSRPVKNNSSVFLTNTLFNRGISGGPVFALRNGASGFEWVGMAKSAAASDIFYLSPAMKKNEIYSKSESYQGEMFINKKKMINYGVTYSVSIQEMIMFVHHVGPELEKKGLDVQRFFYQLP